MRLCDILRSPDFEPAGGSPVDEFVTISRAELDELRAKAQEVPSSRIDPGGPRSGREDFAEEWKAREAAHSREILAREQKAAELERAYKAALLDRELATALVGKSLVPGAAAQLIKLWRDDFEVVDEDGEIQVLARDGRGVDQAVLDRLNGPEFAHFCLPSSRGGTGAKGQNRSSSVAPAPASPKTLGEAVLLKWRESALQPQGSPAPSGWGRRR
jgi:hypothetical protein